MKTFLIRSLLGVGAFALVPVFCLEADDIEQASSQEQHESASDVTVNGIQKMQILEKYRTSQERLETFSEDKTHTEAYNKALNELQWDNPAPGIDALPIDKKQLPKLVGDRIVLMMHEPRDVDVPYFGDMIRWKNARFVTAITEVPMSDKKMRQLIIDNDNKDGWKDVEPFVKETEVLYRHEPQQVGLRYKIQAKISIIRVNGNVYIRNRYEDNGDISSLFLTGDMGIALGFVPIIPKAVLSPLTVANVRRWEFIPIDEQRSYVAITDWVEVMNDTHLSKRMSQYDERSANLGGISDEDLVGPYPGVAVNLYNFKNTVLKLKGLQDNKLTEGRESETQKAYKPEMLVKGQTPDFVETLDKALLESLMENGPVVFIHPKQVIQADYGTYPLHFVTGAYPVKASFEDTRRMSAKMNHYADYVPQLESSKLVQGSFEIPDFSKGLESLEPAVVQLRMSLGKGVKMISSFDIDYSLIYRWESQRRLAFEAGKGDIETVLGAVEWLPGTEPDKSILFYTSASDLGPNPKFPLSLSQNIPGSDIMSGVMVGVMASGRQGPWIELQLAEEKSKIENQVQNQP